MSKKMIFRLLLLVIFAGTLSGCSSLRARFGNSENSSDTTTTDLSAEMTAETYTSVQKVREAQTNAEAVQATSTEVDAALEEADSIEDAQTLNTQDVGL